MFAFKAPRCSSKGLLLLLPPLVPVFFLGGGQGHDREGKDLHPGAEDLNTGQDDEQLDRKMGQLEHHRAAFGPPGLLPVVQPVGDQAPADGDERFLGDNLLP